MGIEGESEAAREMGFVRWVSLAAAGERWSDRWVGLGLGEGFKWA